MSDQTRGEWVHENNWPYRPLWPANFTKNLDRALRGYDHTEETDDHLHEANALAHKVARAALVWRDVPDHTPAPQDFNLTMSHLRVEYDKFMSVLAEYEEIIKDGEKE